jgi:hypothetical protein
MRSLVALLRDPTRRRFVWFRQEGMAYTACNDGRDIHCNLCNGVETAKWRSRDLMENRSLNKTLMECFVMEKGSTKHETSIHMERKRDNVECRVDGVLPPCQRLCRLMAADMPMKTPNL